LGRFDIVNTGGQSLFSYYGTSIRFDYFKIKPILSPARALVEQAEALSKISKRGAILFLSCLLLVGLVTVVSAAYILAQPTFTIVEADKPPRNISGDFATVAELLTAAGISLRPEDLVAPPLESSPDPTTAIRILRARPVTVRQGDTPPQTYWTQQTAVGSFLREQNILVTPREQLFADGEPLPYAALETAPPPAELEIGRFVTVTIVDDGVERTLRSSRETVGDLLSVEGITIFAADGVTPPLGSRLAPGMEIAITRSVPVRIEVDGRILQLRSHHATVGNLLTAAGITLVGKDYTLPPLDAPFTADQTVRVMRVTEDFRLEDTVIPFQTVWQANDQIDIDTQGLISAGVTGINRQRIRMRYENGILVDETVDGEWVARQPVNEVIGYGTKITVRTLNTPEAGPLEYWRVVRMRVTAYTAASSGKAPDHPAYGITASGRQAGTGVVAIDRNVVPWRSSVYVAGYGVGFAGDTGGGVRGRWIDLGYDAGEYVSWSGYVDVYYLTPVPPADDINYILPANLP
jgi:uncharacterized protein YabE (DUF348 family)/3D (Asp-Asp-Asp) domain-containing protein